MIARKNTITLVKVFFISKMNTGHLTSKSERPSLLCHHNVKQLFAIHYLPSLKTQGCCAQTWHVIRFWISDNHFLLFRVFHIWHIVVQQKVFSMKTMSSHSQDHWHVWRWMSPFSLTVWKWSQSEFFVAPLFAQSWFQSEALISFIMDLKSYL